MNLRICAALLVLACVPVPACALEAPQQTLEHIRAVFRSHLTPRYVSYTLVRKERTVDDLPDLQWSYTYHIWFRSADHAALGRRLFGKRAGSLEFMRPAFNEARDPGPPTADLFQPAPRFAHWIGQLPDPEPTVGPPLIGSVLASYDLEYTVTGMRTEGTLLHLFLTPRRDPQRNRLRELWADGATSELVKVIATERVFMLGGPVYEGVDTISLRMFSGRPVISNVHTQITLDSDTGAVRDSDYTFCDIAFPSSLPDWYFEPATYGAHLAQAPQ